MVATYDALMALTDTGREFSYGDRETMLYALGVGLGRDALDETELDYVFERGALKTVPTMATVLSRGALLRGSGVDYAKVLHGEQRLTLHRPLPPEGDLIADSRVSDVFDKGADKGALILMETAVRTKQDNEPLYTTVSTIFARGDGGLGGPRGPAPAPNPIPDRAPDESCSLQTRPDQALLYRLNGDRNPLHADPDLAKRVGFPVPILHGLCTYGTACVAILKTVCDYDHTRINQFDVRFTAPVYPGETVVTDMWREGDAVAFQSRVAERDVLVLGNGRCGLAA